MKEIMIKITYNDEGGYKGHGEDTPKLILDGVKQFMEIDMEGDNVVTKGWKAKVVTVNLIP